MKKLFFAISILLLVLGMLAPVQPGQANPLLRDTRAGIDKIDPALQDALNQLQPGDMQTVIVTLQQQADVKAPGLQNRPDRQQVVIETLQAHAQASQRAILAVLQTGQGQGRVSQVVPLWIFNGLSVTASADMILELAARDDVSSITPDAVDIVPVGNAALAAHAALAAPESNLARVNAPALWSMGYSGQGIVVANLDSGVSVNHPDLVTRWRGGSNSWYDPYGQHPTTPTDLTGHGTWTMGVIVGGDAGGTTIGMAPQAQWIAAKIFNDSGSATATAIHLSFQWVINPDGNSATADAPHVVNNSWAYGSPGCNLSFQLDLQSLRAAGILPVFAAGNYGPGTSTSVSPANYPEAFAVGSADNNDVVDTGSSRGSSACGETQTTYPELVAPGVNIFTSDLGGLYTSATGTSLSAPHAAGALALLLNAFPGLNVESQAAALTNTALDLGPLGADNDYGYGRLDVLAAYQWLAAGNRVTPTPAPTATSTPTPTPTATPNPLVNLALNKTVSVSSFLDGAATGSMAVDGNMSTMWKTQKYSGKTKPPTEWITVDLGSSVTVGQVILDWDAYYASNYSIQVSNDNAAWSTVFSAGSGNGGNDSINFTPTSSRYIKLLTTGWNNSSLRNWLREMQVYSGGAALPTPTPTTAPLPSPTPTPGAAGSTHIGDLDGAGNSVNRKSWSAAVTVLVHNVNETPLAGATVSASWSTGGSGACVTDALGRCQVSSGNISTSIANVTFSVTNITFTGSAYQSSSNHDPDGDSSGTMITVYKP